MSLPVMPSTHTWVQGGPVLEKAGRNTLYASDAEVVWVWDEDTGNQVTDLRDASGATISVVPIVNGWVTGVGVPVATVLPSFSVGQNGPHYPALPIQTIRNAGGALVSLRSIQARNPDVLITGTVTRDANEAATSAPVTWPDGTPGTYTALVVSSAFPGAVDSYQITYGSPVIHTYTQPPVTRDANGATTSVPAITVT